MQGSRESRAAPRPYRRPVTRTFSERLLDLRRPEGVIDDGTPIINECGLRGYRTGDVGLPQASVSVRTAIR